MGPRQLALLLLLAIGLPASAAPLVRNPLALPKYGNEYPLEVYTGNFAGDGAKDVLTVVSGHSIQVLVNGPAGIFGEPIISPITEDEFVDAATGDVDGDGDLDVAVSTVSAVIVYTNDGAGTFTHFATVAGQRYGHIDVGDFTGDGLADIVLVRPDGNNYAGEALVYPGNGAGAFVAPRLTKTRVDPKAMRVADVNGDGKRDLLVGGSYGIDVLFGNGHGDFALLPVGSSGTPGSDLATGDFDADGDIDFVVPIDDFGLDPLRVFLNQGNGTFAAAGDYRGMDYFRVDAADVDADGRLDLIGGSYAGGFAVLRGNGDGTFAQAQLWQTGHVWDIAAGDFNRDTIADVVMLGGFSSNTLQFVAGTGAGAFDTYRMWLPNGYAPVEDDYNQHLFHTTAADVNGDGAPDVLSTLRTYTSAPPDLSVMLNANDGTGSMLPPILIHTGFSDGSTAAIAVGDINGDGKQDVFLTTQFGSDTRGQIFLGRNDGIFDPLPTFAINRGLPRLVDVTGDAILDLVLKDFSTSTVYRGTGSNSFVDPLVLQFPVEVIGDMNGDGRADLAGHYFRDTTIALNNGNGTAFSTTTLPDGDYAGIGALEDLDGDGHRDLLLVEYSGTSFRHGNGDGTFAAARFFYMEPAVDDEPFYTSPYLVRTGDFDADGDLDLVRGMSFYLGHGDGTFDGYAEVVAHWAGPFDVADVDGNGTDDLAVATGDDAVAIIRTGLGPDPASPATIELESVPSDPQYAQAVNYIATLEDAGLRPMGAVVFARDGTPFAMLGVDDLHKGALAYHPQGPVTMTATYTGDDQAGPVTATLQHNVGKAQTIVSVPFPTASTQCGRELEVLAFLYAPVAPALAGPSVGLSFFEGPTLLQSRLISATAGRYGITGLTTGTHAVTATFAGDANYLPSSASLTATITPTINAAISAGSTVFAGGTGYASANAYGGATYNWTIANGTIDSGQGTPSIRYTAGPSGEVSLGLTITRTSCGDTKTHTVSIVPRAAGATMLYLITPCRAVDTRGGAPIGSGATREIVLDGLCGIPGDAKSLVVNLTALAPAASGWLSLYPSGIPWPGTSTLNYRAGKTRANNAIVPLGPGAKLNLLHDGPPVHFLIDVTGYFR